MEVIQLEEGCLIPNYLRMEFEEEDFDKWQKNRPNWEEEQDKTLLKLKGKYFRIDYSDMCASSGWFIFESEEDAKLVGENNPYIGIGTHEIQKIKYFNIRNYLPTEEEFELQQDYDGFIDLYNDIRFSYDGVVLLDDEIMIIGDHPEALNNFSELIEVLNNYLKDKKLFKIEA